MPKTSLQRLKYVALVEMGQSPPSTEYSLLVDSGLPFLQGTADFGSKYPLPRIYCASPTKVALPEDILFSVRAPVGELNIADREYGIGRGLCAIRCKESLNQKFAWWVLHWGRIQLGFKATGSTYEAVSSEDVENLFITLPPLSEQQAIARYLDQETAKIDELIKAKKRLLELLDEKRRALITHAVTRGLNSDVTLHKVNIPWLDLIPRHWNIERAKYLFTQSSLSVRDEDEIVTCFRDGQVTLRRNRREEGFTNAILELGYQGIRAGQLVLHSMDAFAGAIGISDSDGKCSPEYIICDPINENLVFNPYYGYLLQEMARRGFIQASCPAVRERAPRIRFSGFAEMLLPIPPLIEQKAIVNYINNKTYSIDSLIATTNKTIKLLQERRTSLITAAVTGQIKIKE